MIRYCLPFPSLFCSFQFSSVQLLSRVRLFATPWIAAHQASLSITNSRSSPKLMSIKLVMPSSYLILCHPLLLLPPIPPSIRVFSNESTLRMRWPKYWSFSGFNFIRVAKPLHISLKLCEMSLRAFHHIVTFKFDWNLSKPTTKIHKACHGPTYHTGFLDINTFVTH